ncbi:MAG: beta-lactamase family protein [Hyphomonadaceae bacterium]|nr:beta-lactamase family protein [Hyphomonadaceae bacterium]
MAWRSILAGFMVAVALPLSAASAQTDSVSAYIREHAQETQFSGTVLISQEGRTIHEESFGVAERAFGAPITHDTRFPVASITKLFTSALVLQLVDQGRLELDAPISAYIGEDVSIGGVTLRQLLNHTSGLPQFDNIGSLDEAFGRGLPNYQRPMTLEETLALCCTGPLAHPPGTVFDYNNADYFLVEEILRRVTGRSFEELLQERFIVPLNLNDTGVLTWNAVNPGLASTYFDRPDTHVFQRDMPVYWENWRAAGAMYSTARDLAHFAEALFDSPLLSARRRRDLLTPALDEYGLGLWVYSFQRHGRTYHVAKRPGSIMGANAVLYRLLDQNVSIILVANTNRSDLDVFAQRLAEHWIDASR